MKVGAGVPSTNKNDTKVLPCEESVAVDSSKKAAEVAVTSVEDAQDDPEGGNMSSPQGTKLNRDLNHDGPATPKTVESNHDENVCESISSSGSNVCLNDVPEFSVTNSELNDGGTKAKSLCELSPSSSEQADEAVKPIVDSETQSLAISSPSVSTTSISSLSEQISIVTYTNNHQTDTTIESLQLRSEAAAKEPISLVQKLAMNSSFTVSRKETKSDPIKTESVLEGRVLPLRPIPKTEPPKPLPKPSSKPKESRKTSTSSNSGSDKFSNKASKGQKRKLENVEGEAYEKSHSAPSQHKGFKKMTTVKFNPAFRRECTGAPPQAICSNLNPPHDQQECAQYLSLQPLIKFRCSSCGISSFQTWNALIAHKAECTTNSIGAGEQGQPVKTTISTAHLDTSQSEPKSANIKLTRKVFLCSACGTYYELWNLFLHMREAHRRYICLECLDMFSSPVILSEHLKQKHGVVSQIFENPESFSPSRLPKAFYLMCINCDKTYTEGDKFTTHKCPGKRNDVEGVTPSGNALLPVDTSQTEPKSANIKQTRKVFLCCACGTYYKLWNLFLHMREAHRRYICLECLCMFSSLDNLFVHLKQKHGVYSEGDKFTSHKCPGKRSEVEGVTVTASGKNPVVSSQTQSTNLSKPTNREDPEIN